MQRKIIHFFAGLVLVLFATVVFGAMVLGYCYAMPGACGQ